MAFYSILQELFELLITDFMDYVIYPLLKIVFGQGHPQVDILPFKLSDDLSEGGSPNDQGMEQGAGFEGAGGEGNYNGNQFQDENQRSVFMASIAPHLRKQRYHFRHKGRWWTRTESGLIKPMTTAV